MRKNLQRALLLTGAALVMGALVLIKKRVSHKNATNNDQGLFI